MRYVLDTTASLISGSVALLALFPGSRHPLFQPGDLDVYSTRTQYTHLIRFFAIAAGYVIDTARANTYFRNGIILQVFRLKRDGSPYTINVIVSMADNAMMPIFKFHSTIVMNAISGTGVFSAYIAATTSFKGAINSSVFNLKSAGSVASLYEVLQKYNDRGFKLYCDGAEHAHQCTEDALCPATLRSIIDRHSFFMKFQKPVAGAKIFNRVWRPHDVITWALGGIACPSLGAARVAAFVRKSSPRQILGSTPFANRKCFVCFSLNFQMA
ncbi:hypothetical protein DFH09DRAFT_900400 [Mycena vulgaris]|nr:hypothetical protein DFH09DRAFT_900400 [Mycena vulgaris]